MHQWQGVQGMRPDASSCSCLRISYSGIEAALLHQLGKISATMDPTFQHRLYGLPTSAGQEQLEPNSIRYQHRMSHMEMFRDRQ